MFVGIDAPRTPLPAPRAWYWERAGRWRPRAPTDRGHGRHCEVVISALRLANPQWTPLSETAPGWMNLGFALYRAALSSRRLYEVFPSASYTQLSATGLKLTIELRGIAVGPKDILDAYVAAATVREFVQGRGSSVGGGDGLGAIVLPRKVDGNSDVLTWPS